MHPLVFPAPSKVITCIPLYPPPFPRRGCQADARLSGWIKGGGKEDEVKKKKGGYGIEGGGAKMGGRKGEIGGGRGDKEKWDK